MNYVNSYRIVYFIVILVKIIFLKMLKEFLRRVQGRVMDFISYYGVSFGK